MRPLLKVGEVAELLNVSTRTVYALVERDEIPHARVGGQIRFVPDVLDKWLLNGEGSNPALSPSSFDPTSTQSEAAAEGNDAGRTGS